MTSVVHKWWLLSILRLWRQHKITFYLKNIIVYFGSYICVMQIQLQLVMSCISPTTSNNHHSFSCIRRCLKTQCAFSIQSVSIQFVLLTRRNLTDILTRIHKTKVDQVRTSLQRDIFLIAMVCKWRLLMGILLDFWIIRPLYTVKWHITFQP